MMLFLSLEKCVSLENFVCTLCVKNKCCCLTEVLCLLQFVVVQGVVRLVVDDGSLIRTIGVFILESIYREVRIDNIQRHLSKYGLFHNISSYLKFSISIPRTQHHS